MTRRPKALVAAMAFVFIAITGTQVHARQTVHYDKHGVGAAFYAPQYQVKKHPGPGRYVKAAKGKKAKRIAVRAAAAVRLRAGATRRVELAAARGIAAQIMPHPHGCPSRRFCGCGTAQYLLGQTVTRGGLAVAANWLRFPRAAPGPGMAAARRGHVFAIVRYLGGNMVLAYDPNSGRGRTRLHVRPLTGFTVVNPHGWRVAAR